MDVSEWVSTVAAVVGSLGVVGSLLLLAWQTRQLTHQTRDNNRIAVVTAMHALRNSPILREVLLEHPAWWPALVRVLNALPQSELLTSTSKAPNPA